MHAQECFDLYRTARLELQRAAITVRIRDARTEITTRLQRLRQRPDLHHTEQSAIQDSLNNLPLLEREEERLAAEDRKRIVHRTVQTLKAIAPRFGGPNSKVEKQKRSNTRYEYTCRVDRI